MAEKLLIDEGATVICVMSERNPDVAEDVYLNDVKVGGNVNLETDNGKVLEWQD